MRFVLFSIFIFVFQQSLAAPGAGKTAKKSAKKASREVDFDELLVQGKHHFSDEAVVTVEQDKVLDALLEIKKNFKDRMKKSAKRN